MKRTLIIPAVAVLLTGLAAQAQESNNSADGINPPAPVLYSADQPELDDLSIEQLNALQLARLQQSGMIAETDTDDPIFTTQTDMADADVPAADGAEGSDEDAYVAMGGPDYASEQDAMRDRAMQGTIGDLAAEDPRFSTLVSLVEFAGLTDDINAAGPYTVFAPTNAAFEKLDPAVLEQLKSGSMNEDLETILKAHIVSGSYDSDDIAPGETTLTSLAGTDLVVDKADGSISVDDAAVSADEIDASNGVIHAIDTVIVPDSVKSDFTIDMTPDAEPEQ